MYYTIEYVVEVVYGDYLYIVEEMLGYDYTYDCLNWYCGYS